MSSQEEFIYKRNRTFVLAVSTSALRSTPLRTRGNPAVNASRWYMCIGVRGLRIRSPLHQIHTRQGRRAQRPETISKKPRALDKAKGGEARGGQPKALHLTIQSKEVLAKLLPIFRFVKSRLVRSCLTKRFRRDLAIVCARSAEKRAFRKRHLLSCVSLIGLTLVASSEVR